MVDREAHHLLTERMRHKTNGELKELALLMHQQLKKWEFGGLGKNMSGMQVDQDLITRLMKHFATRKEDPQPGEGGEDAPL